jgi:hypothetical protein
MAQAARPPIPPPPLGRPLMNSVRPVAMEGVAGGQGALRNGTTAGEAVQADRDRHRRRQGRPLDDGGGDGRARGARPQGREHGRGHRRAGGRAGGTGGERVVHVPRLTVNRARRGTVGGQAKGDPPDAPMIADQPRLRDDFRPVGLGDNAAMELRLLVGRRGDPVVDQTRRLTRLRYLLASIHSSLERDLEAGNLVGPPVLLGRLVTAGEIRRVGCKGLIRHLKAAGIRRPEALADKVLGAAGRHPAVKLPDETATAELVREPASEDLAARRRIRAIETRLGGLLAAQVLAQAGDLARFRSATALAAAGLAPVLRQSGRSSRLKRPAFADKGLKRVFYQGAFCSLFRPDSRAFDQCKRREGKRHGQAVLALARRRVDVLWAMLQKQAPFQPGHRRLAA